ncbi:ribosome biogenesis GTP-binding protein YihA/YsxC [Spiroplasma endosymbiont of Amphibalanus improvisus]|uniref:ribosome biogenesis GTP-binding protein YihA/YsxC n=1 Tax=Spiroplasma endosymbiont of Amphibalanus improvisus TaxID=3066327 RepID=UPI00313D5F1C
MLKIFESNYVTSAVDKKGWINDNVPEICFIGRSNVGKSSFINMFTNRKNLARVASLPGKTRMLNFFSINRNQFRIVDAPGYGYAKISEKQKKDFGKLMDEYLSLRQNLKIVFFLLDSRRIPNEDDLLMKTFLDQKHFSVIYILTKVDKLKKNEIKKNKDMIIKHLNIETNKNPMIMTSSLKKTGLNECLDYVSEMFN